MSNNGILDALYGLKTNPFALEFKQELSPSKHEELSLYAKVEGFGKQVSSIDNWFTNTENLTKSNCILVYGFDGSGRTSVVNYILWRFCEAKKINLEKVTSMKTMVKNEDNIEPIKDLLEQLEYNLSTNRSDFSGSKLEELYEKYVYSSSDDKQLDIIRMLRRIFNQSKVHIKTQNKIPIIILENINNYQQLHTNFEVFNEADLIICTTTKPNVYETFKPEHLQENIHGFSVNLSKLELDDVIKFICGRWEICSEENKQHPFDENGLKLVFGNPMPFKGVVKIITEAFNNHVEEMKSKPDFEENNELKVISQEKIVTAFVNHFNPQ